MAEATRIAAIMPAIAQNSVVFSESLVSSDVRPDTLSGVLVRARSVLSIVAIVFPPFEGRMERRTQTNPLATYRAYNAVSWFVVRPPDCEETIEAGRLERSHRRLRTDEDKQMASLRMLAPARANEQEERGRVDESDQAEVDGQVAHSIAAQLGFNRLCQGIFDRRGAIQVELASEDENRCLAPTTLEGQCKIVFPGGSGLRPHPLEHVP
jgi:hypothetical protein